MIPASYTDKERVVEILAQSFRDNPSVNLVVKQTGDKRQYIRKLMEYSFEVCFRSNSIYLSADKNACALIIYPDTKRSSLLLDIRLIIETIGFANLGKVLRREKLVKQLHPTVPFMHLWYIGVDPQCQQKGIGTALLLEVINEAKKLNREIYLETSVLKNISWYKKFGFSIYRELPFANTLYLLKC